MTLISNASPEIASIPPFEDLLVQHGSTHNNLTNRAIHIACVPFTLPPIFMLLQFVQFEYNIIENSLACINLAVIAYVLLMYLYVRIDKTFG